MPSRHPQSAKPQAQEGSLSKSTCSNLEMSTDPAADKATDLRHCGICSDSDQPEHFMSLPCKHGFHPHCIGKWVTTTWTQRDFYGDRLDPTCPMCRAKLAYACGHPARAGLFRAGLDLPQTEFENRCGICDQFEAEPRHLQDPMAEAGADGDNMARRSSEAFDAAENTHRLVRVQAHAESESSPPSRPTARQTTLLSSMRSLRTEMQGLQPQYTHLHRGLQLERERLERRRAWLEHERAWHPEDFDGPPPPPWAGGWFIAGTAAVIIAQVTTHAVQGAISICEDIVAAVSGNSVLSEGQDEER